MEKTRENGVDRRRFILGSASALLTSLVAGFSENVARAGTPEKQPVHIVETAVDTNFNASHTQIYNRFIARVEQELQNGSYTMRDFKIERISDGHSYTISYSIDLVPATNPHEVQRHLHIIGTILDGSTPEEAHEKSAGETRRKMEAWLALSAEALRRNWPKRHIWTEPYDWENDLVESKVRIGHQHWSHTAVLIKWQ